MEKPTPQIYKAIAGVIKDIGHVGKDKVNQQQGFRYRSIDDVYNALHPALAKNGVFVVPQILNIEKNEAYKTKNGLSMMHTVCKIKFTFYAEDGSSIESIIIGEGLDSGDKGTNKAMSIAYKYACFQVFCIPTEEMMDDPDKETPQEKEKPEEKKPAAKKNAAAKKKPEPAAEPEPAEEKITPAMVNTIRAEQKRTGVKDEIILKRRGIKAKTIEEMTVTEFKHIMNIFEVTPDKKED